MNGAKMAPRGRVVAYHCSCCGAPCDPEKKLCDFCAESLVTRYKHKRSGIRVKAGDQYVVDVRSFSTLNVSPDIIDVRTLESDTNQYVSGLCDDGGMGGISVRATLTEHLIKQFDFGLRDGDKKISIEYAFGLGYTSFELSGRVEDGRLEAPSMSASSDRTIELILVPSEYYGLKSYQMPQGMVCPNCGAPLKSRYGCCEYCGGWTEWVID